jgi:uncharacterized repeat protein (TIGR01451 family)
VKRALAAICLLCAIAGPDRAAARGAVQPAWPLLFEPAVSEGFVARGPEYTALLRPSGLTVAPAAGGPSVLLRLLGADPAAKMAGKGALPGRSNYYLGDDPARWRVGVRQYGRVTVDDVYPGIDLLYHARGRELELDFVVAPGADPRRIQIGVDGGRPLEVDAAGDLVVPTDRGSFRVRRPEVYQEVDGVRRRVEGRYARGEDGCVGFQLAAYDTSRPLVIDPVLGYASRVGGSDVENGYDVAIDADGNVYLAGGTASAAFPAPAGEDPVLQGTGGSTEAFVVKLAPDGTILYSTLLGGTSVDQARGIGVDDEGNAYVAGTTSYLNTGFPTTPGVYRSAAADFFVSVLDPNGALTYSTFFGGLNISSFGGLAVYGSGADARVYFTGTTVRGFPTTPNAWETSLPSGGAAFLTVLEPGQPIPGDQLLYSTVFGHDAGGAGLAVAAGPDGRAYVAGNAVGQGLPLRGAFDTTFGPNREAFLAVFDPDQSGDASLVYSTYIGGFGSENDTSGDGGVAVDANGVALVTGTTGSNDFPVTPEAIRVSRQSSDAFLVVVDPSLPGADSLRYGTFLGGSRVDHGTDVAAGPPGIAYVTGYTSSDDIPDGDGGIAPKVGAGAAPAGSGDALLLKIDWTRVGAASVIDAAYVGGTATEVARAIASRGESAVVIGGDTTSTDGFVPSPGSGSSDAFAVVLDTIVELPDGTLGAAGVDLLTADFGTPPYAWSVVDGAPNPGLALAADGALAGVPTALGSAVFTAEATDSLGAKQERTYRKRIATGGQPDQILIRKSGPVPVPGRIYPYRILLRNTTQETLTNIEVTEILDYPLHFVSATPPPVTVHSGGGNVIWVLPQLAPGEFRTITYNVQLPNDTPHGTQIDGTACLTDEDCNKMRVECEEEGLEFCENTLCQGPGSFARCEGCKQDEKNRCREKWNICKQAVGKGSSEVLPESGQGGGCATDVNFVNAAIDPNEKDVSSPPFVPPGEILGYAVQFENVGTIEARDVFVTDVLDPDLDLSTVQVQRPLGGLMPLPADATVSILDDGDEQWSVSLDTGSRTLSWELLNINLLPDATDSVYFTVQAPEDLPSGTEIRNQADIQFEVFEIMATNETLNTIDATPPTCTVDALPAVTVGDQVELTWTATDAVGEVGTMQVYVSEDGGPFGQIGETTEADRTTFVGAVGSTYGFLCLAQDTAGNVEVQDLDAAETETQLTAAEDVTDRLAIGSSNEASSLDRLRRRITSTAEVELENTSGGAITAAWRAAFVLSDPAVEMPEADGFDPLGRPFYDLETATGASRLAPGEVVSFPVVFVYPAGVNFSYAVTVTGVVEAAPSAATACGMGGGELLLVGVFVATRRRRWSRRWEQADRRSARSEP